MWFDNTSSYVLGVPRRGNKLIAQGNALGETRWDVFLYPTIVTQGVALGWWLGGLSGRLSIYFS